MASVLARRTQSARVTAAGEKSLAFILQNIFEHAESVRRNCYPEHSWPVRSFLPVLAHGFNCNDRANRSVALSVFGLPIDITSSLPRAGSDPYLRPPGDGRVAAFPNRPPVLFADAA